MTEKELRRLNRRELLEMLLLQSKKLDKLQAKLDEAESSLENRQLDVFNSGSLADAAAKVNGIFEVAQATADQYLENIREKKTNAEKEIDESIEKAKEEADRYISESRDKVDSYLEASVQRLERKLTNSKEASAIIAELNNMRKQLQRDDPFSKVQDDEQDKTGKGFKISSVRLPFISRNAEKDSDEE